MGQLYMFAGLMLLVAGAAAFGTWTCWRRVHLLSHAEPTSPGQASRMTGRLVKVDGCAQPDAEGPPRGPITDAPCAFWECEVQEERYDGERTRKRTIRRERSEQPFLISDADGSVRVRPSNVRGGEIEQVAHDTGESERGIPRHHIERQVPIDHRVYALGTIVRDDDGTPSLERGPTPAVVSTRTFRRMRIRYAIGGTITGVLAIVALLMLALTIYRLLGGTPLV